MFQLNRINVDITINYILSPIKLRDNSSPRLNPSWCNDFGTSGYQLWYFGVATLELQGTDFGTSGNRLWYFGVATLVLRGTDFGTKG